jgi:hypothetical protein
MSDTNDDYDQALLFASIGHCIMQWAFVELQLILLFHKIYGSDREAADLFWGRIRSFDAKMLILNDLAKHRLENDDQKRDWILLHGHTMTLYSKRNQVAHSTLVHGSDGSDALEPFAVPTRPAPFTLSGAAVDAYAEEFQELKRGHIMVQPE